MVIKVSGVGGRGAGGRGARGESPPQQFWYVGRPGKNPDNPGKNGAQRLQKTRENLF